MININLNDGKSLTIQIDTHVDPNQREALAQQIAQHIFENSHDFVDTGTVVHLRHFDGKTISYTYGSDPKVQNISFQNFGRAERPASHQQEKLFYWEGILADPKLLNDQTKKVIDKLAAGDYKSADLDLKRSKTHKIYGARINQSDRLLFTTISLEGNHYLLLLEIIPNHDYQKSRFLNHPEALNHYIDKRTSDVALVTDFEDLSDEETIDYLPGTDFEPARCYNRQFLRFSDEQNQALQCQAPLLITGTAGSGKTCIAQTLLQQLEAKYHELETQKPILYVTRSNYLVQEVQSGWNASPHASEIPIYFTSYETLIKEQIADLAEKDPIKWDQFESWLGSYRKKLNQASKPQKKPQRRKRKKTRAASTPRISCLDHYQKVIEEFRLLSVYTKNDYMNLGQRQSGFTNSQDRKILYEAFEDYKVYLESNRLYDPAFVPIYDGESPYHFIVIDEAQDFSRFQLQQLTALCGGNIAFCLDTRQSLYDSTSVRSYIEKELFKETELTLSLAQLPETFRCPPAIARFANGVWALNDTLSRGKQDKSDQNELKASTRHDGKEGVVKWLGTNSANFKQVTDIGNSPNIAVVVDQEHMQEAREKLSVFTLFFTPEEIKGREYPQIILYQPLKKELYKTANQSLSESTGQRPKNRAKSGEADETFRTTINSLFVSITRATDTLYLIQDYDQHAIGKVQSFLQEFLPKQKQKDKHELNLSKALEKPQESLEDQSEKWLDEAKRLIDQNLLNQAKEVIEKHLNRSDIDKLRQLFPQKMTQLSSTKKKNNPHQSKEQVAASSSKKNENERNQKLNQYATSLLGSFTARNIDQLLNHPNLETILFKTQVGNEGNSLFYEICAKQKHIFFACLLNNKQALRRVFHKNYSCLSIQNKTSELSALYWLTRSLEGLVLLKTLFDRNPKLVESITHEALCATRNDTAGADANTSALYWLTGSLEGLVLLKTLFDRNPKLVESITHEALCATRNDTAGADANTSALFLLAANPEGRDLLKTLFDKNPKLMESITHEALCATLNDAAGAHANTSALYCLAEDPEGRDLLKTFFDKNPKLMESITHEALCATRNDTAGARANTSALYWLAADPEGRDLLKTLFDKNPKLMESITHEALCATRNDTAGAHANTSALYWLTGFPESLVLLKTLFDRNPKLVESITHEALCATRNDTAGADANTSALYCLAADPEGRDLLKTLFDKNPKLVESITHEALCATLNDDAGADANTSALYWLAANPEDLVLLKTLFDKNPKLVEAITHEALCATLNDTAGADANTSALYWLTGSPGGLFLLKTLFDKNPKLVEAITHEALCATLNDTAGANANTSALYWLAADPEGLLLLKTLFDKNPKLVEAITHEALCATLNDAAEAHANTSALFLLAANPEGRDLLKTLFDKNPKLVEAITHEALCATLNDAAGAHANTSALYWLAANPEGRDLLKTLFDKNPKLMESITHEALCTARNDAAGADANTSALYCLAGSSEGRDLLKTLFDKNPKLVESITHEALCAARNDAAGADANTSALYCLAGSHKGLSLLKTLFDKNPKLMESITHEALCATLNDDAGAHANTSALYYLAGSPEGLSLLKTLFNRNPSLVESITHEALCAARNDAAGADANTSALYRLAGSPEGIDLLRTLFNRNPSLVESITHEALRAARNDIAGVDANTSALSLLSLSPKGQDLLETLFDRTKLSEINHSSGSSRYTE